MQKGILVKDGVTVIAKQVYAGDISDETMTGYKTTLEAAYPDYTVTLFASDEDPDFANAE